MTNNLVVARYAEDLTWLDRVPSFWHTTIYDKNPAPDFSRSGVIGLPNVGREGESFLRHIILHYESLADLTLFVQGNPFDHVTDAAFFELLCTPGSQTRPVGGWLSCLADGSPHHPGIPLVAVWNAIGLGPTLNLPFGFCPGAQWLVRKEDILQRPVEFYQNCRNVLLQNELNGYCLERLWGQIWGYSTSPIDSAVWGLMYTHHKVPDQVLAQSLATIRAMGLSDEQLVVSCRHEDNRLPERARKVYCTPSDEFWIPAIYEQMIAGLEMLPVGDRVLTLEHDVFYPMTYLDQMAEAMTEPDAAYYYTLVRHLDISQQGRRDFWASDPNGTRTLQSCCGGRVETLLSMARQDLAHYRAGKLTKDFELGVNGRWRRVDGVQPVLDVRWGNNTSSTGYDKTIHFAESTNAYWGQAHQLRSRLERG